MKNNLDFSMVIASSIHDMKNSLGMLLNSLDELRLESPETFSKSAKFNTLQYEAERMHSDLIQLLGIYRLGEKTLSAHIEEHYLPDFLEQNLARHLPLLDGHNLQYELITEDVNGFFDDDLLAGVLGNIINNAIRYTRSKVRLFAKQLDGYLVIGIEDDGEGYPEQMRNKISMTANSLDFESGSTNLGLFFSSQIAQLHQNNDREGFIKLHNNGELGGGVFEIWLP